MSILCRPDTSTFRFFAASLCAGCLLAIATGHALAAPAADDGLDTLGMPTGPWPFVRRGPTGSETYLIPTQLDAVRRLPEPDRQNSLRFIREHEANLAFLRKTSSQFFRQSNGERLQAAPEYTMDLGEVLMGINPENAHDDNPLRAHEPLLLALPTYTRVVLLAPATAMPALRARLEALRLGKRVRLVASQNRIHSQPGEGVTRWVRDLGLIARDGDQGVLLASLAHRYYRDVARNDLAYLVGIGDATHRVLRLPVFLRGGNVAVARADHGILLVGEEEIRMNEQWFAETFGFSLLPDALPNILRRATGTRQVVILPNSRHLYHLDMFIVPLGDGAVGLLTPEDPEHLAPQDREVLIRAHDTLHGLGFRIVPIPTSVDRMRHYQSATNSVIFTERGSRRRRALVPVFPEPRGQPPAYSLNARVLAAYRSAGIEPIPVEDRFHERWGNTHCALLPLH